MKDKTVDEIAETRHRAIEDLKEHFPNEELGIIDTWLDDEKNSLWKLGRSIQLLSTADVAYFTAEFDLYRGCRIEYKCADEYGINRILETRDDYV